VNLTDEMKLMEHATLTERVKNLEQQLAEATNVIEKLRATRVVSDEEIDRAFKMTLGQAIDYVFDFFKDDSKACAWFLTANPNLGGIKPVHLIVSGRKEKIIKWIKAQEFLNTPIESEDT
jgi:uncharacterized protein (DUF2384 family)